MGTTTKTPEVEEVTVEQQVNELLKTSINEEGKLVLPEDIDPALAIAVRAEKKARDTQASYTRSRQELAHLRKKVNTYETLITSNNVQLELSQEQLDELDELKVTNPEEWHKKLSNYEEEARKQVQEKLTQAEQDALEAQELARREAVLEEFNKGRTVPIDDNVENLVPAIYLSRLDNGDWTFEEFLEQSAKFIDTSKAVTGEQETLEQPSLGEVGGREHPKEVTSEERNTAYNELVF